MSPALQGRDIPPGGYVAPIPAAGPLAPGDARATCPDCDWTTVRPTTRTGTGADHAASAHLAHRIRHHGLTIPLPDDGTTWITLGPTRQDRR